MTSGSASPRTALTPAYRSRPFVAGLLLAVLAGTTVTGPTTAQDARDRRRQAQSAAEERRRQREKKAGTGTERGPRRPGQAAGAEAVDPETAAKADRRSMFLKEPQETATEVPEIWRCQDCGYEQDEPGTCPDHGELVAALAKGKNPLGGPELDGNEDLLVDVPLPTMNYYLNATATPDVAAATGTARAVVGRPRGTPGAARPVSR